MNKKINWKMIGMGSFATVIVLLIVLNLFGVLHWTGPSKTKQQQQQEDMQKARPFDVG